MTVKDVVAECPHSKFSVDCTPAATQNFWNFDSKNGRLSAKVPMLKEDVKVSCKVHKEASNGDHEDRVVDIVFKAAPESICSINKQVQSVEMEAGTTGSVQIAMLGLVDSAATRRNLASCGCNGSGSKPC